MYKKLVPDAPPSFPDAPPSFPASPPSFPAAPPSFRRPYRHSRESGNPPTAIRVCQSPPGFWIPAFAGMKVGGGGMTDRPGASQEKAPLSQKGGFFLACALPSFLPYPVAIPAPPPSFLRKQESTTAHSHPTASTGVLDSGFRRNDGGGSGRRDDEGPGAMTDGPGAVL